MITLPSSTYLDAFANLQASPQQFGDMLTSQASTTLGELFANANGDATVETAGSGVTITLALVLNRAIDPSTGQPADPTALLASPWGERQAALADQTAVWNKYGADPTTYNATLTDVAAALGLGDPALLPTPAGYLSTAQDRTIWLTLDAGQFQALFGTQMLEVTLSGATSGTAAWGGLLSLPDSIAANVGGIWVEQQTHIISPYQLNTTLVDPTILADGNLGIGNGFLNANASPAVVASNYSFPLAGSSLATDAIALIEGGINDLATVQANLATYRTDLGFGNIPGFTSNSLPGGGTSGDASEYTLDISVVSGAAPNSAIQIYNYSDGNGGGTPFNAYQRAFFDSGAAPVLSSSYPVASAPTANSPFQWAWQQLFVDGALRNISTHVSAGDQGSSGNIANGIANVPNSQASPMALVVGGTSIAALYAAEQDPTLQGVVEAALQGDKAIIFQLVAAGLLTLPSNLADSAPPSGTDLSDYAHVVLTKMVESVWQRLNLSTAYGGPVGNDNPLQGDFGANETGLGGFASGVPIPSYQSDFGLTQLNRSTPDVSALAGGDYRYYVLNSDYVEGSSRPDEALATGAAGTSAATPLWASLTTQFNAVLADQGLPYKLGFYNDLLYQAAAIAPGSFNDIRYGNNINSFVFSPDKSYYANTNGNLDDFNTPLGVHQPNSGGYSMIPTGEGYAAGESYDMASGLGTPNGLLLARTLSAIAHSQVYYSDTPGTPGKIYVPDLLDSGGASATSQTVLLQYMSDHAGNVDVQTGSTNLGFSSDAAGSFAWTSRFAEQTLQPDFDPALVILFDKQPQGSVAQSYLSAGESLSVSMNGVAADAIQGSLTNPFGFADFATNNINHAVRVARAVAVAETAGGLDDQNAIVRVRQGGENDLAVAFYKVDDLAGTIGGVAPGQAAYMEAMSTRLYQLSSGGAVMNGPGYGNFAQAELLHVNAGDMIAMAIANMTTGNNFFAFSQANPDGTGHLWNYGLNTWGWEDQYGGGDHDYNDLVVQLDFTSHAGHGLLV